MKTKNFSFEHIVEQLQKASLGGYAAQTSMEHDARKEAMRDYTQPPAESKRAAVVALLFPHRAHWCVALIIRNTYDGVHSAQIAFPGGSVEPSDRDLQHTALRETFEEVGVEEAEITLVRPLTPLYIPVSNFWVQPFVGVCASQPTFVLQADEVTAVLKTPLQRLLDPKYSQTTDLVIGRFTLKNVPYYDVEGGKVWGATAMMLSELLDMLKTTVLKNTV